MGFEAALLMVALGSAFSWWKILSRTKQTNPDAMFMVGLMSAFPLLGISGAILSMMPAIFKHRHGGGEMPHSSEVWSAALLFCMLPGAIFLIARYVVRSPHYSPCLRSRWRLRLRKLLSFLIWACFIFAVLLAILAYYIHLIE